MAGVLRGRRQRFAAAIDDALEDWLKGDPVWGVGDCIISIADIIRRVRGYDPAQEFRGRYTTMRGALRVTKDVGGFSGAVEAAAFRFSWRGIDPRTARIGDVGLIRNANGLRVGVIRHRGYWYARGERRGIVAVKSSVVEQAWRVS